MNKLEEIIMYFIIGLLIASLIFVVSQSTRDDGDVDSSIIKKSPVFPTPTIKYVYITPEPTQKEVEYKYNIAIGAAGQVAYQRYIPSYCSIAIGAAGQIAKQGDCTDKDYKIIEYETNK